MRGNVDEYALSAKPRCARLPVVGDYPTVSVAVCGVLSAEVPT
jgi:hypothetical protein